MSRARSRSASSAAEPLTAPVLGALACAAARLRGLSHTPEALSRLTRSALFEAPVAALDAPLEPLVSEIALDPGRLGELSAQALRTDDRKRRGVFYTPAWAADRALDVPTTALGDSGPVLDPACGGGRFLLAAFDRLTDAHGPAGALALIRGLDTDPLAVAVARAALYLRAATRPDEALPVAEAVAQGDLLALHGTGAAPRDFAAVVGNPPYRGGRFSPVDTLGPDGLRRFRSAEYQVDPYVLFVEASLAALRPGGRLALVLPNTFMSNLRTGALRRLLRDAADVEAVLELPAATFGAAVETIVLRAVAGGPSRARVPVLRAVPETAAAPEIGAIGLPAGDPQAPWPLLRRGEATLPAASGGPVLGDLGELTRGINPYHHTRHTPEEIAARVHHADHAAGPEFTPELRGRDLQPFRIAWQGRHWIRWGPWLKEPRHPRFFEGPRLLVRKILGPTLVAAYTDAPFHVDQSIYILKLRADQPWPPLALLGIVGSRVLADLLRARHQEHDTLFPQLKVAELRAAPLPPVSPDAPAVHALATAVAAHLEAGAPESGRGPLDAAVEALYRGTDAPR